MKILFDVEYQSDSSYQLLLRFCGPSLELPDPFDEHRDEKAITRRMAEATTRVKSLLDQCWEVCTAGEVRLEHEAWTRRMQPPKEGSAPGRSVDRQRTSQSFFGALSPTSKRVTLYPIEGNRNTEQTILAPDLLQRETEAEKIAVVLDNARFHHAKALTGLYEPGRLLERITPIHLPPYAPDHNPVEHVRNAAKNNIATIQHETPRRNPRRVRLIRHWPRRRPRLRTPPTPRNQKRSCSMTVMFVCAFLPPDQNGDSFRGDLNLHAPIISKKTHQIHQKYDFISRHSQDTALIKIRTKTGTPRTRDGILSPPARHRRPRTDAVHGADGPTPDRRTVRRMRAARTGDQRTGLASSADPEPAVCIHDAAVRPRRGTNDPATTIVPMGSGGIGGARGSAAAGRRHGATRGDPVMSVIQSYWGGARLAA